LLLSIPNISRGGLRRLRQGSDEFDESDFLDSDLSTVDAQLVRIPIQFPTSFKYELSSRHMLLSGSLIQALLTSDRSRKFKYNGCFRNSSGDGDGILRLTRALQDEVFIVINKFEIMVEVA
ncbi:hypothetical protein SARC_01608, partial [Sphaeroforma arctica JP610]